MVLQDGVVVRDRPAREVLSDVELLIPFLVLVVAGTFLPGGHEQLEAAEEMMAVEEGPEARTS